jgi:hypothetical protein
MNGAQVDQENQIHQRMTKEERIQYRIDENGTKRTKVCFGGAGISIGSTNKDFDLIFRFSV